MENPEEQNAEIAPSPPLSAATANKTESRPKREPVSKGEEEYGGREVIALLYIL